MTTAREHAEAEEAHLVNDQKLHPGQALLLFPQCCEALGGGRVDARDAVA